MKNMCVRLAVLAMVWATGAWGQNHIEVLPNAGPFEGGNIVVVTNAVPAIGTGANIHNVSIGGRLTAAWVDSPEIIGQGTNWVSFVAPPARLAGITTNLRIQATGMSALITNQVYTYYPRGTIGSQAGRWRTVGQDFVPESDEAIGMAGGVTRVRALHWTTSGMSCSRAARSPTRAG